MSVAVSIPSITANKVASSVRIQLSRDDYALRIGLLTLICFLSILVILPLYSLLS